MLNRTSVVIWSILLVLVPAVAFSMGSAVDVIKDFPAVFYSWFALSSGGLLGQGFWIIRYIKSVDKQFEVVRAQMDVDSTNVQIIADKITRISAEHDLITKRGQSVARMHDC